MSAVVLTVDEVGDLCSSKESLKWLETLLLCDPSKFQEAVYALCSQLTRGKDFCSVNKRVKLRAIKLYFAKLAGFLDKPAASPVGGGGGGGGLSSPTANGLNSSFLSVNSGISSATGFSNGTATTISGGGGGGGGVVGSSSNGSGNALLKSISPPKSSLYGAPPLHSPLHPSNQPADLQFTPELVCSVLDFSSALIAQSPRWGNIPPDEVLSLATLIDSASSIGDGIISWENFYAFSLRLDARMQGLAGETLTNEAFAMLYEEMATERLAHAAEALRQGGVPPSMAERLLEPGLATRLRALASAARLQRLNPLSSLLGLLSCSEPAGRFDGVLGLLRSLGAAIEGDELSAAARQRAEQCASVDLALFRRHVMLAAGEQGGGGGGGGGSPRSPRSPRSGGHSPQPSRQDDASASAPSSSAGPASASASAPGTGAGTGTGTGTDADIETSLSALRDNAAALAAKLASQSDSLDSTMSIWSALQTLESELSRARTPKGKGKGERERERERGGKGGDGQSFSGAGAGASPGAAASPRQRAGSAPRRTTPKVVAGTFAAPQPQPQSQSQSSPSQRSGARSASAGAAGTRVSLDRAASVAAAAAASAAAVAADNASLLQMSLSQISLSSPAGVRRGRPLQKQQQQQQRYSPPTRSLGLRIETSELDGGRGRSSSSGSPRSRKASGLAQASPLSAAAIAAAVRQQQQQHQLQQQLQQQAKAHAASAVLAQRSRERRESRDGKPSTPLPFQTRQTQPQPSAPPAVLGTRASRSRSASASRGATTTTAAAAAKAGREPLVVNQKQPAHNSNGSSSSSKQHASITARCRVPLDRANMSIFKSPGRRQASENVNVYDADNFLWVPTGIRVGRHQERFQSTHDIMEARKMFGVLYRQAD